MPLLEVLAIDVGGSIAKAIVKRWLGDSGPIPDTASSIVDVLKTRTADRLAQRRADFIFFYSYFMIAYLLSKLFINLPLRRRRHVAVVSV